MNALVITLLALGVTGGNPAMPENPLLKELVEKGVAMPDGQIVHLPAPTMAEGLNAEQQAAVLTKAATLGNATLEKFLDTASNAAVSLKQPKPIPAKIGNDVIRTVNLHFVVYGDWNVLTDKQFSKGIVKEGKAKNADNGGMVQRAGYLETPNLDLGTRGLSTLSTPVLKEYFLYTTFNVFGEVELSTTRFCVATKTPAGVIVAAKVDPRFAADKAYPNQWRTITKNAQGNPVLGPVEQPPYSGAAFYAKVTRLIKPQNAIFIEFHQVFYEPEKWFGENVNRVPSELKKIIPYEVKQFRIKLAIATQDEAEKKLKEEKPAKQVPSAGPAGRD